MGYAHLSPQSTSFTHHRHTEHNEKAAKMKLRSAIFAKSAAMPPSKDRFSRIILLIGVVLTIYGSCKVKASTKLPGGATERSLDQKLPLNETRVIQMTDNNRQMIYLHKADIMFMTLAKAGSSSLWHWLYRGVTGRERWDGSVCDQHVHDKSSNCWDGHASYLHTLNPSQQLKILTSERTLRVALQREPYERIISAFKSKFTCEDQRFSTDVHERERLVTVLRKRSHLPEGPPCMNVSEFALALDVCRQNVGRPGYPSNLAVLDDHIRPQEFFLDEVNYDMIIDVKHLSNVTVMQPIIDRVEFKDLVKDGISARHSSGAEILVIPEDAATMLHAYSLESKQGSIKFILDNRTVTKVAWKVQKNPDIFKIRFCTFIKWKPMEWQIYSVELFDLLRQSKKIRILL